MQVVLMLAVKVYMNPKTSVLLVKQVNKCHSASVQVIGVFLGRGREGQWL